MTLSPRVAGLGWQAGVDDASLPHTLGTAQDDAKLTQFERIDLLVPQRLAA
jgi:hypothetical protein